MKLLILLAIVILVQSKRLAWIDATGNLCYEPPEIKSDVVIVLFTGKARVGKSTLINQLIGHKVSKTSDRLHACTKGINYYIWGKYMLLDAEGIDLGAEQDVIRLSSFAAVNAQLVYHYTYLKQDNMDDKIIRLYQDLGVPRVQVLLRTNLQCADRPYCFQNSLDILDTIESDMNKLPPRSIHIVLNGFIKNIDRINRDIRIVPYSYMEQIVRDQCMELKMQAMANNKVDITACLDPGQRTEIQKIILDHCTIIKNKISSGMMHVDPFDCRDHDESYVIYQMKLKLIVEQANKKEVERANKLAVERANKLEVERAVKLAVEQANKKEGDGLFAVAGLGILTLLLSDERYKTDITWLGYDGTSNVYSWRYIFDNRYRIGYIAQELQQSHPEYVIEFLGVLFVKTLVL